MFYSVINPHIDFQMSLSFLWFHIYNLTTTQTLTFPGELKLESAHPRKKIHLIFV